MKHKKPPIMAEVCSRLYAHYKGTYHFQWQHVAVFHHLYFLYFLIVRFLYFIAQSPWKEEEVFLTKLCLQLAFFIGQHFSLSIHLYQVSLIAERVELYCFRCFSKLELILCWECYYLWEVHEYYEECGPGICYQFLGADFWYSDIWLMWDGLLVEISYSILLEFANFYFEREVRVWFGLWMILDVWLWCGQGVGGGWWCWLWWWFCWSVVVEVRKEKIENEFGQQEPEQKQEQEPNGSEDPLWSIFLSWCTLQERFTSGFQVFGFNYFMYFALSTYTFWLGKPYQFETMLW